MRRWWMSVTALSSRDTQSKSAGKNFSMKLPFHCPEICLKGRNFSRMINWGIFPNRKSSLSCKAFFKDSCNMAMIKRWWKARDEWRITLKRLIAITINLSSLYFWTGIDFLLLWVGWRSFCEMDRLNLNQCLQSCVVFPRFKHRITIKLNLRQRKIYYSWLVLCILRWMDPVVLEFFHRMRLTLLIRVETNQLQTAHQKNSAKKETFLGCCW